MKKFGIYIIILILVLLGAGVIYFLRHSGINATASTATLATASPTPTETPYPKVDKFEVPILMYHYIRNAENENNLGKSLSVSPTNFEMQMQYLRENDYEPIKLSDLADPDLKTISELSYKKKKPVVITFDDGYEDAYTSALPILEKYKFTGTFFIIRNFTGQKGYLNKNQIMQMEVAGMEIGSHSLDHVNLAVFARADQEGQIVDSKEGAKVFCYPFGKYSSITSELVKNAGYLAAVTTHPGIAKDTSNLFELPRVRMENTTLNGFKYQISSAGKRS